MKVAIIHYWFITWRGGEKVVKSLLKFFPDADIYSLFYDKDSCEQHLGNHKVISSVLNNKILRSKYQKIFPLYPLGINSMKLRDKYDLIISSESGPAKGIQLNNNAPHLCYIHTPMRYCWGFMNDYLLTMNPVLKPFARLGFEYLKKYDISTIDNVDKYVANSENVKNRVKKYYNKNASVVYPPIDRNIFTKENLVTTKISNREYYLSFGAITPYKNINLLVDTFNANGKRLIIIGDGSERQKLIAKANNNIFFTGSLEWNDIRKHIMNAKALLFPGEEDFGMVPLEVMAHGVPVIAYGKGGALETVVENMNAPEESTGLFFKDSSVESLQKVIEQFEIIQQAFSPEWIQNHARQFGDDIFEEKITKEIQQLMGNCSILSKNTGSQ
ncbi:MAG: glycosyltransferase [Chitinispirillaceae bacterium]|nr:glycosyltransferase [Chitinispirillaceae bacterium]